MILKSKDSREIEVVDIIYGVHDSSDTFIASAYYIDDDEAVSDDVLDWLGEEYSSELNEAWHEHQMGRAEYLYED